jgi:hypothetical protein
MMGMENNNIEKNIRNSGLKNPSENFTQNILNNLPENVLTESNLQIIINKFSWLLPLFFILAGLVFVIISIPLPELSISTFKLSLNLSNLFDVFSKLFSNVYILAGVAFVSLFFFIEIGLDKIKSINFMI